MTAFNGRLKPKRVFGIPVQSITFFMIALPMLVIGLISKYILVSMVLFAVVIFLVIAAIFFLILGDEVVFIKVMILSKHENNNVTSETWTKF